MKRRFFLWGFLGTLFGSRVFSAFDAAEAETGAANDLIIVNGWVVRRSQLRGNALQTGR